MTLMSSISKLTTSVDQLTGEANVTKAQLDAKVALADAEVVAAQAEQAATEAARDEAAAHAATAATHLATVKAGVTYQGISAILAEKAVTAVDVFVYDTSLDSDGGAWRKRCQHTSWYNEPLNTATRGARREFPAVAVIVAETSKVTIYDGDDPSLPMWMVFNGVFNNAITSVPLTSLAAVNGTVVLGTDQGTDTTGSALVLNFLSEKIVSRRPYGSTQRGNYLGNILQRNSASGWDGSTDQSIVAQPVNDVAMTVLPDAPIDPATGLPVPTIAVATDGGVSVIKDDGTVQNIGSEAYFGAAFAPNGTLLVQDKVFNKIYQFLAPTDSGFVGVGSVGNLLAPNQSRANSGRGLFIDGTTVAFSGASTTGINSIPSLQIYKLDLSSDRSGYMNALLTSTYNTGWMNGDIKGAFLSDTDDTDLVASGELVTNGTFDTDTSGWDNAAPTFTTASFDAGTIEIVASGGTARVNQGPISTTVGQVYNFTVTCTQKPSAASSFVHLGTAAGGIDYINNLTKTQNAGEVTTYTFRAISTELYVQLGAVDGTTVNFDNISARLADADRSVNNKGLIVNGTITRSPVADGAELVAYSGFSAANYLEQPYNSALDFGTGDLCVIGWAKVSANGNQTLFERYDGATAASRFGLYASGAVLQAYIGGWRSSSFSFPSGQWVFVAGVRSAGVFKLFANGVQVYSGNHSDSLTGSGSVTRVGLDIPAAWPLGSGSISLLRLSATAPTPDQIAKIYEDERKLFQPGAGCTLYGTSDAVTALAHDPKTNLLHVGTSAGRSTFDGLVRVANTTTPVATAISAVNGLIAEQ